MKAHSRENLAKLVADLPTKSAKIRKLNEAGLARAEIARFLGLRYQHVRNVLVADEKKAEAAAMPPEAVAVKLDEAGRVLLPAAFRDWLGARPGEKLILKAEDGELQLLTQQAALNRARSIIRQHVPEGVSLVDELIAGRRAEAARE